MGKSKTYPPILQILVSVVGIEPRIWRRLLLRCDTTLARLHKVLQVLMGWSDCHLYDFIAGERRFSPPNPENPDNEKHGSVRTKITSVFAKGVDVVTYEYDFGDEWEVEVRLEAKVDNLKQTTWAICTDGARHGPVEDSGGPRGYKEKIEVLKNPKHKRHLKVREWIGPDFDPEEFDLVELNEMLKELEN